MSERDCFQAAAAGLVAVVAAVGEDQWDLPGLGEWSVLDLVGHASRALSTVSAYLASPPGEGVVTIHSPVEYLLAARSLSVDPAAIAQRGRDAGAALAAAAGGPAAAVRVLADDTTALVAATPDSALVGLPFGGATLAVYLPTRTFELTVHTLDLVAALGGSVEVPAGLAGPIAACLSLAAAVAGARPGPDAGQLLLALTGRRGLPAGFSVI